MDGQRDAMAVIAQCYTDGEMEIHGRKYTFTKTTHKKRLSVYSYMTGVAPRLGKGDMTFMDTPDWERIEKLISDMVMFDDSVVSKLPEHWEKFPQDYLLFATTAMQVISHPFLAGNPTD